MLDLAAGTRFFERLEALRAEATGMVQRGPGAARYGIQATGLIGKTRTLLNELGGIAESSSLIAAMRWRAKA